MRHFNWLVRMVFYKHKEHEATAINTRDFSGVFYDVGFIDQLHANLCTNASENMLYNFAGQLTASMVKNPRGIFDGRGANTSKFSIRSLNIF